MLSLGQSISLTRAIKVASEGSALRPSLVGCCGALLGAGLLLPHCSVLPIAPYLLFRRKFQVEKA